MAVIDLARFRSPEVRVFAGRERGEAVRQEARLDDLDSSGEMVEVKIPEDVFSVNSSFFLAMFGPSIRTLGAQEFRRRYQFSGRDVTRVMEAAINEATQTTSPLG